MPSFRRHEIARDFAFSSAQMWELLAQTDHFNRHIGLAPVFYQDPTTDEFGIYRPASAKICGLRMHWREYLFRWEKNRNYTVVRRYSKGPIALFEGGLELEELGENRTRLKLWSSMQGRGFAGQLIAPLIAQRFLRRSIQYCNSVFVQGEKPPLSHAPPPRPREWNGEALENGIERLRKMPVNDDYALALGDFIRTSGEDEVASMRPFDWADEHGFDRHEVLRLCLYAVRVGLFNLRWTLMCPNCRVAKDEVSSLAQVGETVHCDLCGVNYDLNFDRYVELRFSVHPGVRTASSNVYCLGGPFLSPHVIEQYTINPGTAHPFRLTENVALRLRVIGRNHSIDVDSHDGGGCFVLTDAGWVKQEHWNDDISNNPSVHLCAANRTDAPLAIVLEKRDWDEKAVTASLVTALQEFRDLFSSEVLAPGRQVAVENVTLFFSDLSNSTALYEEIGDAPAFSRVGSHFDFLLTNIAEGGGAVVKTMGDAVMAVFNRPEDAAATAMKVQRQFRYFSETLSTRGDIKLKIGLHCGPVLAVNSNDRLDYFGRTVNLAARAVGVSQGGDIVMTGEVWESDEVQKLVAEQRASVIRFQTRLRGVEDMRDLVRVKP